MNWPRSWRRFLRRPTPPVCLCGRAAVIQDKCVLHRPICECCYQRLADVQRIVPGIDLPFAYCARCAAIYDADVREEARRAGL